MCWGSVSSAATPDGKTKPNVLAPKLGLPFIRVLPERVLAEARGRPLAG